MKSKIGILGSGAVARTLANGFLKHGYSVMLGTRNAGNLAEWKQSAGDRGEVGTFEEAAAFGEIVVLAVSGTAADSVLKMAGAANLSGKTVIDVTNPIAPEPPVNGVIKFFTSLDDSLMERFQKAFPGAHFVKSFSCVGNALMVNPNFPQGKPTMFICGNDNNAKEEVKFILDRFGWDIADMGMAEAARAIEPLCILWCIPGFLENNWTHAFKMLRL